jgi:beta-xylosidase
MFPLRRCLLAPVLSLCVLQIGASNPTAHFVWRADNGDGTYRNPIIYADYSDPDVVRVGNDYYMTSSSFQCAPGLPILHSKDLVNWRIIGHALPRQQSPRYDLPRNGEGCWAPSLRYHAGQFWIYYGDPDLGIYLVKTSNINGPWQAPVLVKSAKGWIDPCPLWDDDGSMYLVHAWAKSRAGFNAVLSVNRLSSDGTRVLDDGTDVFKGGDRHPTIEGPKFYKRNGYYYIFAPAGGVKPGWQVALRSRNVFGPYEDRVVLHQGSTDVNGPHQGAWIDSPDGTSWFVHFQDRDAYGRIIHLQPMTWRNDWPVMGVDRDGTGNGEPVMKWPKPKGTEKYAAEEPQTTDEFNSPALGLQWQWNANPSSAWYSLTARKGFLRLYATPKPEGAANLWAVPNLLLQKFPAPKFTVTTRIDAAGAKSGDRSGLLIMGSDYAYLAVIRDGNEYRLVKVITKNADHGTAETIEASKLLNSGSLYLRVSVQPEAICQFSYSDDGKIFHTIGDKFSAQPGRWIGARVGLFAQATKEAASKHTGFADFDWLRIE